MGATIAIVGRPNVGKSTLFNRLIGSRHAIVDDVSGVTRDRIYGVAEWGGTEFSVVDTGGFVPHSSDVFEKAIKQQVDIAIEEADIILFMVDTTVGITDLDLEMANKLRKTQKPVALVINKVDNFQRSTDASEFYALGFEHQFNLSAITGSGSGELLDFVKGQIKRMDKLTEQVDEWQHLPKFAVIGQPNVGKSSFLNAILGKERTLVTDIAGTTRDSIHTRYNYYQKEFLLIDTAGVRKKAKVHEDLEFYSVMRAVRAIDQADVCFLMIDATVGIERQDLNLLKIVERKRKGLVILVNKWDLIEKETQSASTFEKFIKERMAPFTDVPVVFISVITKQRIHKALEVGMQVYENKQQKITTSKLNDTILPYIQKQPPPSVRGKHINIKYITQVAASAPTFAFFTNYPKLIKPGYRHYLENKLRKHFNFSGVSVNVIFKEK